MTCRTGLLCALAIALSVIGGPVVSVRAAPENPLIAIYNAGMTSFNEGKYPEAIAKLQEVIAGSGDDSQLESVYFTIASCYFNQQSWDKAAESYKVYLTKFPKGAKQVDARLAVAQCKLFSKNFADAATLFKDLEGVPALRDRALYLAGSAFKEANRLDDSIAVLERLITPRIANAQQMRGAVLLVEVLAAKGEADKAVALMRKIELRLSLVENPIALNGTAVKLGDKYLTDKKYAEALACYRMVRLPGQVVALQEDRIKSRERRIQDLIDSTKGDAKGAIANKPVVDQIKLDVENSKKLLEEFKKLPDYAPAMYLRMAQCFYELGRKWEAIVLYRDILDRWPTDPNREQAMFAMLVAYAEVERNDTALKYCRQFLKDFPTSKNAATVGFLTGATALQSQDPAAAETYFGTMLQSGTDSQFKEEMQFLIANARMMQGKNDEAITGYRDYLKANPSGTHVEEAEYRIALSTMLKGQYGEAVDLLNAYVKKYPSGFFVADSEYRMLIASYAERDFTNVVSAAEAWEQRHPSDQQLGEVIALKADALSANQREDDAAVAYARAAKVATTDEVLNYAIFEANKSLQKQREWDKVIALWTDFLKDRPNHPLQVSAVYWIAAAQVKQGKEDEARKYVADTVATYIGDPDREAVEQLLSQLAQLCAKKKRPRDKDGNFIDPATLPAPPDPATALDDLLRPAVQRMAQAAKEGAAPPVQADPALAAAAFGGAAPTNAPPPVVAFNENTAKARMLYAKAELATFRRRASDATNYYDQIATSFKPEDLSPWLLGKIGDHALATGQTNQAAAFYRQLLDDFPKASVVDFAYAGLSDIAYRNQDYATALKYCDDALDRGVVGFKAKEIDLGRARALQATDKLEDARKAFEAIASNKNYRGEATAEAVFHLGEIAEKQGKLPEANAYYQRVYVAYRKYLPWVARSYLRSGKVFEAVGDKKGALNTYNEMMREEKLQTFPEAAEIRARINQLEPQVQAAGKA